MIGITDAFSTSYARARARFLEAAATAGLPIESHAHPLKGREGEDLAMDVVRDGPADADKLLIVSSACHGVEGYCGSGVQVFALRDDAWREEARTHGVTVLYIHALNPYGFSHVRRTTHENVDLNRNFQDFSRPLPVNEAYREVEPFLLPPTWPPAADNVAAVEQFIATQGEAAWQAAISQGQHEFAQGMFFGGTAPTWSNRTLRQVLRQHGSRAQRIGWIDLHTGLGPSGHGERIYAGRDDPAATDATARLGCETDQGSAPGRHASLSHPYGGAFRRRLRKLFWPAMPAPLQDGRALGRDPAGAGDRSGGADRGLHSVGGGALFRPVVQGSLWAAQDRRHCRVVLRGGAYRLRRRPAGLRPPAPNRYARRRHWS